MLSLVIILTYLPERIADVIRTLLKSDRLCYIQHRRRDLLHFSHVPNRLNFWCAKQSLAYLAGESPVAEGEPIPLCIESCVNGGNKIDEA